MRLDLVSPRHAHLPGVIEHQIILHYSLVPLARVDILSIAHGVGEAIINILRLLVGVCLRSIASASWYLHPLLVLLMGLRLWHRH